MKRLLKATVILSGVLVLGVLVVFLAFAFKEVQRGEPASQVFKSPIKTPTIAPTPTFSPRPSLTPTPRFRAEDIKVVSEELLTTDGQFAGSSYGVAWSPKGDRVAFARLTGQFIIYTASQGFSPVTDLWAVDIADGRTEKLADRGAYPVWSPDGQRLVFVSWLDETHSEVQVLDVAMRRLRKAVDDGVAADWLGTYGLAITMKGGRVQRYDLATTSVSSLTDHLVSADGPNTIAVSPDGRWLNLVEKRKLWLINPDAPSSPTRLTDWFDNSFRSLVWSPRSNKVAYVADKSIWIAAIDAPTQPQIVYTRDGRGTPGAITWSPDGNVLAFHGLDGITLVNADGSGLRTLMPYGPSLEDSRMLPLWSPDGAMMVVEHGKNLWVLLLSTNTGREQP